MSRIHPCDISAVTADSFQVFVAAGPRIYAWRRGTELQQVYSGQGETVTTLLTFGPKLVSVDTSSQCVGHLRTTRASSSSSLASC